MANRSKLLYPAASWGAAAIPNDQRLDGWKAIANFLGRERTTAIRWANGRGLPVHRVPGGRTGTVYALRSELEAWLSGPTNGAKDVVMPVAETPTRKYDLRKYTLLVALVAAAALAVLMLLGLGRTPPAADGPVTVAAIAASGASRETQDFARALNADLARFANATPELAVFEREPGAVVGTQYAVRTDIDRASGKLVADARLIAMPKGEVLWSHRFDQSGPSLSALRDQIAANIVGVLRCSFGGLEDERPKVSAAELGQLMTICQEFEMGDMADAQARVSQLTLARPDLGLAWAMLANIQGELIGAGDRSLRPQALASARRALAIAPNSVCTFLALAAASGDGLTDPKALKYVDAALRRHRDHPWLLNSQSVILFNLGYVSASVDPALNAIRNDPGSFGARDVAVRRLSAAGRTREALKLQEENEHIWPGHPLVVDNRDRIAQSTAARRAADLSAIAESKIEFVHAPHAAYLLARLYERSGNHGMALEWLARAPARNAVQQWSQLFWPDAAGLRAEPAFFRKMVDLGLARYWIARRQWPDFCNEPGLKYDCATEAKKLGIA